MPFYVLRHIPFSMDAESMTIAIQRRCTGAGLHSPKVVVEMAPADPKFGPDSKNKGFCVLEIAERDISALSGALANWKLAGKVLVLEKKRGREERGRGSNSGLTKNLGATPIKIPAATKKSVTDIPTSTSSTPIAPPSASVPEPQPQPQPQVPPQEHQPQVQLLPVQDFYNLCLLAEPSATSTGSSGAEGARVARGFINRGNTCYRNASIQCLLAAPPIAKVLVNVVQALSHPQQVPSEFKCWGEMLKVAWNLHLNKKVDREVSSRGAPTEMVKCGPPPDLDILLTRITHSFRRRVQLGIGDDDTTTTETVLDRQEDAMEFVTFLLDVLHEEEERCLTQAQTTHTYNSGGQREEPTIFEAMNGSGEEGAGGRDSDEDWETVEKANVKSVVDKKSQTRSKEVRSIISRLFHVRLRQSLRYVGKKRVSNTFTAERFINVIVRELPADACTTQDAFDAYFEEVSIAPISSGDVEKKKRISLETLPTVLLLQINRFAYDKRKEQVYKVHRSLEYDHQLRIFPRYCSTTLVDNLQNQKGKRTSIGTIAAREGESKGEVLASYRLHSLVLHHGGSPHSGHYTAVTRLSPPSPQEQRQEQQEQGCWLHLDDQKVSVLDAREAVSFTDQVYVLVYCLE